MKTEEFIVNLNSIEKAKSFCNLSSKTDCVVELKSERWVVNGASILGIFSLDLSKDIKVSVSGSEKSVTNFVELLKDNKFL